MSLDSLTPERRLRLQNTFDALRQRGITPVFATDRQAAFTTVRELIPAQAAVAHGRSTTLEQIGLVDYLSRPDSAYRYLNSQWLAESDADRRDQFRARLSLQADYYLGGVQAICDTGEVIAADATGSRQAFYIFGPRHVIWVAGVNKLVADVQAGLRRVREVALPQEDQRLRRLGRAGSFIGKLVIYEREKPGRISLVLVDESLGF